MRTTSILAATAFAALLSGCAGGPPSPAWQSNAHGALQGFSAAYLSGNAKLAEAEFAHARRELSATGRADRVAQAELLRCAVRVASLEFGPCAGFDALAADADPAQHAYAAYIGGRWEALDPALLPAQHRAVASARPQGDKSVLGAIEDPLARLVAAGALLQSGRLAPADIAVAVDTASAQGWRRPLLAWLGVQAQRASQAGDMEEHARIQRRMQLVGGGAK